MHCKSEQRPFVPSLSFSHLSLLVLHDLSSRFFSYDSRFIISFQHSHIVTHHRRTLTVSSRPKNVFFPFLSFFSSSLSHSSLTQTPNSSNSPPTYPSNSLAFLISFSKKSIDRFTNVSSASYSDLVTFTSFLKDSLVTLNVSDACVISGGSFDCSLFPSFSLAHCLAMPKAAKRKREMAGQMRGENA